MTNRIFAKINVFSANEDGVTSIEYGIIAALLSGVLIVGMQSVGDGISNPMTQLTTAINDGGGASTGSDEADSDGSDDIDENDDTDVSESEDDAEVDDDTEDT